MGLSERHWPRPAFATAALALLGAAAVGRLQYFRQYQLNVKAAGYAEVDVWSVVFRGDGFVGAVTMVGPDASKSGVTTLAENAYANAAQSLS